MIRSASPKVLLLAGLLVGCGNRSGANANGSDPSRVDAPAAAEAPLQGTPPPPSPDGGATTDSTTAGGTIKPPRELPPWQASLPGTLNVVSPGSGKKEVLRYAIAPGTKQHSVLEVRMDLATEGPAFPRPTVVMEFATVAGTPVQGGVSFAQTFSKFYGKEREKSAIPASLATETLSTFAGLSLAALLTPNGFLRGVKVTYPETIPDEALPTAQGLLRSIEKVLPQLPSTPVGVGAKWQIVQVFAQDGVEVKMVSDMHLVAKRGSKLTLKGTSTMHAPPQTIERNGERVYVRGVNGDGVIKLEVDLQKPMPSVQQTVNMDIDLVITFQSKMQLSLTSD